jgi:hypothetical protein
MATRRGLLELKGKVFGSLTVVGKVPTPSNLKQRWNCRCVCGKIVTVRHDYLLHTNSPKTHCGCLNKGLPTLEKPTYICWSAMIMRCTKENHVAYPSYGGRGITVCEQWLTSFEQFYRDMGRRPTGKHTLDRIDPDGNYEPGNCRWATTKEQGRNKRTTINIPHPRSGVVMPAAAVAESLGISYQALRARMLEEGTWPTAQQKQQDPTS